MNLKHIGLLLVLFLVSCSTASAQKLNCDELADVLDVRAWRVPMPKDKRFEWSIKIVDYAQQKSVRLNSVKFSRRQKALIALRKELEDTTGVELFGHEHAFEIEDEAMAWELATMSVKHLGAIGCYRAPSSGDGPTMFLAITSAQKVGP